jgi:hypothetical protein
MKLFLLVWNPALTLMSMLLRQIQESDHRSREIEEEIKEKTRYMQD